MARRKKRPSSDLPPIDPRDFRGMLHNAPPDQKVMWGLGAVLLGFATVRFFPRVADTVIPCLASMFLPPVRPAHPEAAEPVTTLIDERQLGRSEVLRELANPRGN
jgi:hypothetical protein